MPGSFAAFFLIAAGGCGSLAASLPLNPFITVSSTNVRESTVFTATVTVPNPGSTTENQVFIPGETLQLGAGNTGYAVPLKLIRPLISSVRPGKTIKFTQQFRAATSGTFDLTASVYSTAGMTATFTSPSITVYGNKPGAKAVSDTDGTALLALGRTKVAVHLSDEDTGSSLGGVSLGLALDPYRKGQAVLAAVDSLGRYPPQFLLLQGPVAGELPAMATTDAPAVEIPLDQSCGGDGEAFTRVMAPIHTAALPPITPVPVPTSSPKPGQDLEQPVFQTMLAALQGALDTAKKFAVKQENVPCDEVLSKDAEVIQEMPLDSAGEFMLYTPLRKGIELLAPETSGVLVIDETLREASSVEGILSTFNDFYLCDAAGADVLSSTTLLPSLPQYALVWNSPAAPDPSSVPLTELILSATDQNGQPISGGSIQLVSSDELGLGVREVIGDGTADLPVPLGDYDWCVRAPGFKPQSGQITIGSTTSSLEVALEPQPVASATLSTDLGQPAGFLPAGTQFVATPTFYDANGNVVQCTGTPVFQVHNPVGVEVATVDPATGLVTIQDGCGAARVTCWCNGIESAPMLVSSDCNGKQPLPLAPSFAVAPTHLTFVAKQGGSNPPAQEFYWVVLNPDGVNTTETWEPSSWLNLSHNNTVDTVSVNISGLLAGTYEGDIAIKDNANSSYRASVHVTLIIEPVPTANVAGTWRGTYSYPIDDVGDLAQFNVVWVLNQSGNSVSGEYGEIEYGSSQQTNGELNDGEVIGNYFSIYDDGGLEFVGTVSGKTISGSVNAGTNLPGSFSVTLQ